MRRVRGWTLWAAAVVLAMGTGASAQVAGDAAGLPGWLASVKSGLAAAGEAAAAGDVAAARSAALRAYLDDFETVESYYGPGGPYEAAGLSSRVTAAEQAFHELLRGASDPVSFRRLASSLRSQMDDVGAAARAVGAPLVPAASVLSSSGGAPGPASVAGEAHTPEIRAVLAGLGDARAALDAGDRRKALALVEAAYLNDFEPLEARLPGSVAGSVERAIHIGLRPALAQSDDGRAKAAFDVVEGELLRADAALRAGGSFWFGVVNAFAIIVREGLEAVLLVGALLAYLGASRSSSSHRRQIYAGVGIGVVATFLTWLVARTLVPIGGAGRELVEGVTGLFAVGVLLYVSNWLAQKTYIHDWKAFLRDRVDAAASAGSALAMAGLAFAAVYREGFETVLFYQALLFDAGPTAVLAGFLPGLLLIVGLGVGIIRLGIRLPLRKVFTVTNTILLYLAFVFLGKGLYNLQEAGLFAPHPVAWFPDSGVLRQLLGLYPVLESLLAQVAFLGLVAATYVVYRRAARRAAAAREAATLTAAAAEPASMAKASKPQRSTEARTATV